MALTSHDREVGLTDRQVKSTVVSRLRENPYTEDAHIKVEVHNGVVRLEGNVPTRLVRTMATEEVETVPGVADIDVGITNAG
jgi:osmotically-inducible protein OsmY